MAGISPCCTAAADINADNSVNISDAIFNLNFLFLGMAVIPPPFPSCDSAAGSSLDCEIETCF